MPGNSLVIRLDDDMRLAMGRVGRAAQSRAVRAVMGRAVANALVQNFEKLDAERHRNETGVRFYAGAARSVQRPQVDGDNVDVAVSQQGVALRRFGGTITAGSNGSGKKWLTIPAIPAALGRRAGSFSNLRFVFFKGKDLAALVSNDPKRVRFKAGPKAKKERSARLVPREDGRFQIVFFLKRSVTMKEDPSVIPSNDALAATASQEGAEYLKEAGENNRGSDA